MDVGDQTDIYRSRSVVAHLDFPFRGAIRSLSDLKLYSELITRNTIKLAPDLLINI